MARIFICVLALSLFPVTSFAADFADVPTNHWAYPSVSELRKLGITNGVGNNEFGLGRTVSRAEFVTFLCNLFKWEPQSTASQSAWYLPYIDAALKSGAITKEDAAAFRPTDPITREEMAVMLVRALGLDALAKQIVYLGSSFSDVQTNKGYITIAKDLGILSGMSASEFAPSKTALREQAASMLINAYRMSNNQIDTVNGFYAIRSANQIDMIKNLDMVSYGWSRLEALNGQVTLNVTASGGNEYAFPSGFNAPFDAANGKARLLMVSVKDADAVSIIGDDTLRQAAVTAISSAILNGLNGIAFDGVVVDFETLRGEELRSRYNTFLLSLKGELLKKDKLMVVAVHPKRRAGIEFYDGYDYKTIGAVADKVILMAHDYNPKSLTPSQMEQAITMTPVAPIDEVYYALKAITDKTTGVEDKSKIMLQLSFASAQWKLKDGKIINDKPFTPAYDAITARIASGAQRKYSTAYESPYLTFTNDADQTDNVLWYEDAQSVGAKVHLAELFGVQGISLWRLGNIPDGVFGAIK